MDRVSFIANAVAKAKMVMDKVETGNYSKGHIDAEFVAGNKKAPETKRGGGYVPQPVIQQPVMEQVQQPAAQTRKSGLPQAILDSFAQNPGNSGIVGAIDTSNPLAFNNFQMSQVAEAAKQAGGGRTGLTREQRELLESQFDPTNQYNAADEDYQPAPSFTQQLGAMGQNAQAPGFTQQMNARQAAPQPQTQYYQQPIMPQTQMLSEDYVKFLINQTVEATVKATVEAVMEQINKPTALDENIQIRIGGKLFGGKIKTLKG